MSCNGFNCACCNCVRFTKLVIQQPEIKSILPDLPPPNPDNSSRNDNSKHWIKIGDRVIVEGKYKGIVKYVGPIDEELLVEQLYVGIKLDEQNGSNNGIINGKSYFTVPLGFGMMAKYEDVRKIKPAEQKPPIYGNGMYPSSRLGRCRSSKQDTDDRSFSNKNSRSSNDRQTQLLVRRNTHQQLRSSKRKPTKSKFTDVLLPPRLIQEASKWKQNSTIKHPDVLKSTLTKLYLAREKGRMEARANEEMKDNDNDTESEEEQY